MKMTRMTEKRSFSGRVRCLQQAAHPPEEEEDVVEEATTESSLTDLFLPAAI